MKWREGQFNWTAVLSRNQEKWVCANLDKDQFNKFKVQQILYENHDANQEIKYTIGKWMIPDFAYLLETFLRHTKVWVKDWNKIEIECKQKAQVRLGRKIKFD